MACVSPQPSPGGALPRVNVERVEAEIRDDAPPPGYGSQVARLGPLIGAGLMAATVRVLAPGQAVCPYHYELTDEEWLLVLAGAPTVRHAGGEDTLERGDLVCFPRGPAGAHRVANGSDSEVRLLIVSTRNMPAVVVYPDSGKLGVYSDDDPRELLLRMADAVDYWDGEPPAG